MLDADSLVFRCPKCSLMFRCPKCGWWIVGTYTVLEPLSKEQLLQQPFDLRCSAPDCGWEGQLTGSDASPFSEKSKPGWISNAGNIHKE